MNTAELEMLNIIKISDIESLIKCINSLPNSYIFRGQSNTNWKLSSTLDRLQHTSNHERFQYAFEDYSLDNFKSRFHLYDKLNREPKTKLEWLSLMQHYGTPTRLLDFSTSPYIALFFAIESYDIAKRNSFALYYFNATEAMKVSIEILKRNDKTFNEDYYSIQNKKDEIFENQIDRFNLDLVWATEPSKLNIRLDRQAGCFVISGNREKTIENILESDSYLPADLTKLEIDKSLYENCYGLLRKVNICPRVIYGDLYGLAKSLSMEGVIYSAPK